MKLKGSAWPLGLALVWNWSLQSMILVWYWSDIDLILIWYRSGIDLVLVWYWSWYWSDIDLDIDLILVGYWKMDQSSGLKKPAFTIEKNQFQYYWSGLIRIDFFQSRILREALKLASSELRVFGWSSETSRQWCFWHCFLESFLWFGDARRNVCDLLEAENIILDLKRGRRRLTDRAYDRQVIR